jgi:hypothetical protein
MSTVPEVIAGKHCGMKVLCLSLVTNKVVFNADETNHASHAEVLEAVEASGRYVESIVKEISKAEILGDYLRKVPPSTYKPKASAAVTVESKENKSDGACEKKCSHCSDCTTGVVLGVALAAVAAGLFIVMRPRK